MAFQKPSLFASWFLLIFGFVQGWLKAMERAGDLQGSDIRCEEPAFGMSLGFLECWEGNSAVTLDGRSTHCISGSNFRAHTFRPVLPLSLGLGVCFLQGGDVLKLDVTHLSSPGPLVEVACV